jgi:hypothetical protein
MLGELADAMHIDLSFMPSWLKDPIILAASVSAFFLLFGLLSRCFERQADVLQQDPRPQRPGRIILVADGEQQFIHAGDPRIPTQ